MKQSMDLYTKDGKPLQVAGHTVYTACGQVVGRIKGDRIFSPAGGYVGTIVIDRLAFRPSDSAAIGSPFTAANRAGTVKAARAASAIWGNEPDFLLQDTSVDS